MSVGDDNIFARWSRRKQTVRHQETAAPNEEQAAAEAPAEMEAEPVGQQPAAEEPDAGEPLPDLENLTAESDISAFLRKGVPNPLKNAALRKIWSLDPAIRDYVGPSEYAWDFNRPGSMAGFGPLDASRAVVEFLSTINGGVQTDLAGAAGPAADRPPPPIAVGPSHDAGAAMDSPTDADSPAEPPAPALKPESSEPSLPVRTKVAAEPEQAKPEQAKQPRQSPRRHGGARPR
ncbi:DUF3306 domain-containing protein [Pseudaminobacter arsenicus]|uniref:DUF3306 domain-containing protein n=1 Tax=Borborobacter arsenicus TaxID=1851146 RepID=A0A432V0Y5_9HYPH|nr:DUF3306 domain-containing protein [Pseudaminobacter arsenicus]RUM95839.1 DUF3306 domain-containing protein [Pseudaminobacter arsenicus]